MPDLTVYALSAFLAALIVDAVLFAVCLYRNKLAARERRGGALRAYLASEQASWTAKDGD